MLKTYSSSSSLVITSHWFATSRLRAPVSVKLVYCSQSCPRRQGSHTHTHQRKYYFPLKKQTKHVIDKYTWKYLAWKLSGPDHWRNDSCEFLKNDDFEGNYMRRTLKSVACYAISGTCHRFRLSIWSHWRCHISKKTSGLMFREKSENSVVNVAEIGTRKY